MPRTFRPVVAAALAALVLAGCAAGRDAAIANSGDADDDETPAIESPASKAEVEAEAEAARQRVARLPKQELEPKVLYEFLIAEIAAQRGDFQTAAQAYLDLARRTRDPRVAQRAVEIARAGGLNEAAVEAAGLWLEIEPDSREALGMLAGMTIRAGRPEQALSPLRRILTLDPAHRGEVLLQIGRLLGAGPNRKGALSVMRQLASDYPDVPEAQLAIAHTALAGGNDTVALEAVRKAAAQRPGWELAALLEAQVLQRQSNAAALAHLEAFLKRYPQAHEVRLGYARLLVGERRYADARTQFQVLSDAQPNDPDVVFALAMLSMQLEDWPVAERHLKRLLELPYRDRNTIRMNLGQALQEQKRYDEALKWYRAVTPGEQFLQAQIRQAQVLARQGDVDRALGFLRKIAAPTSAQRAQIALAESQILRDANRAQEAFDVIDHALKVDPDQPDLLYDRAMIADKLDRIDILESSLRRLIALKPDHAHAYNALGYSLADRNERLPEARALIEKALSLAPNDPFIIDSMAWVLYRQGDLNRALELLRRAYADRPDPEIAAHLGEVLWKLGRAPEAEKIWGDAAAKSPRNEAIEKTVRRLKR